ncbi:phosphatidylinositol 4-kinase gamma 7-like [Neltuma alba]|uniref:phosphatidylinositol 4-kinase gamma 7-like n=1 Tax=Neltuma alba TaxID=207710 RepID=UPI0010A3153F|nr:phosphatidylinositol 4-kinase gamma 7-like [Prosopis alba]XP_028764911.1 phosphatidylinositol 4-kinase gamma 7-like [Prosopis alba]XP_028782918.1 phosphatidylinositol 4-kinase gamma 7-like [Prosopis alba]XP_028782919.1 phosphatidylinositol 4-kinase gamma 7-like [Prosopis alba]
MHAEMAVATFKGPANGECCGNKRMERKPSGKRRVFVQTESGSVLGIELDGSDNAHTVKTKLRLALNVPTEESSLICGDMVLKNDLSEVRNDSPLLLTRNFLHRSSSTPCLSPTGRDLQQRDQSGPIEILGYSDQFARTKQLVDDIMKALKFGVEPIPIQRGLGGAYYFRNCHGENIAIVKPTDEEPYAPNNPKGFVGKALGQPGLKRSVRVGETGFREVIAYLLDHDNFADVPPTALVKITHSIFNINGGVNGNMHQRRQQTSKIASLQQYVPHDFDASDHGTSSFPVSAVHRIGILDIRIFNTDRHAGNLLVRKLDEVGSFGQVELVPIDHGLCLPESLEDPYFEWIHWPQASIPFSEDELDYIYNLDPFRDSELLRMEVPVIREACLRILVLCTIFLKEAAAFGLCLAEIGDMMSREFKGHDEEPSEFELICIEARKLLDQEEFSSPEAEPGDKDVIQFHIDCEDHDLDYTANIEKQLKISSGKHGTKVGSGRNPFSSKLEEIVMEDDGEIEEELPPRSGECTSPEENWVPNVAKLSVSMRNANIGEKSWQHQGVKQKTGCLASTSSGNRTVNELPASSSFVKLSDMDEEKWNQFLENFQRLLNLAFVSRKRRLVGQRQRLGTSCQF